VGKKQKWGEQTRKSAGGQNKKELICGLMEKSEGGERHQRQITGM
jgi:hypothetical protein